MRELLLNNTGGVRATTVRMPMQMHGELVVCKGRSGKIGDEIITEAIALYLDLFNSQKFRKRLEAAGGDVYDAVMDAIDR